MRIWLHLMPILMSMCIAAFGCCLELVEFWLGRLRSEVSANSLKGPKYLPIGSIVAPFCGSYLGSYKVIPKKEYSEAYGYSVVCI